MAEINNLQKEDMNIVIVGHVDHGKSTIIGRLLADTFSLPQGKLDSIKERCRRNSKPFEYAFLLDALKDEQNQGITIDSARCFFKTKKRNYMILDAPGHVEFLKNMVTGASRAEAALLVIDAGEGIMENSKRHCYLLSMLGIKQIVVLINKMDLVNYSESSFNRLKDGYSEFLNLIGVTGVKFIPVSGICGDNITVPSENMNWHTGDTVLSIVDKFEKEPLPVNKPFRMAVQDVYKFTAFGDNRRIVAGTVETGKITEGDTVIFYPSKKQSKIKSIESFNTPKKFEIFSGDAASFTLEEQIYVKRGEIAVKADEKEPEISSIISANLFWLGKNPLEKDKEYFLKIGTAKVKAKLHKVIRVLDASTLTVTDRESVGCNDVAEAVFVLNREIAFDLASENIDSGRFVIVDDYEIAGGGIILKNLNSSEWIIKNSSEKTCHREFQTENIVWQEGNVGYNKRCEILNQKGIVLWLTGLSGAGKSTIAMELETRLSKLNRAVYRLDGDNLRHGLNSNLGFTREDRDENIRRIAETAKLFQDAAIITIVAAISPYTAMREFAKQRIGRENFIEIYIKTDIDECIRRDPKGFYSKAKEGKITGYTGVSDPYEEPKNPDIVIDTVKVSAEDAAETILEYLEKRVYEYKIEI